MGRRDDVLDALRGAEGGPVSGEALARQLGVSRAAVGKHVASLRAQGYRIDAVPGEGYALASAPEGLLPAEVSAHVESAFWVRVEGGGPTGSTSDDAAALAREGAPEGTVVVATAQRTGRGRLGRAWESPEGGVYLSAVLRPALEPAAATPLPLVVALGVALGLERLDVAPTLKWPNDVLLDGGKLAGVLLEMSAEADRLAWVVAGCGVNVARPVGGRGSPPDAAYLEDALAEPVSLSRVAAAVLDGIAEAYARFTADGFAPMQGEYEARFALAGEAVTVRGADGAPFVEGTAAGVDAFGRLVVEGDHGTTAVAAGDVTLKDSGKGGPG
jgi:BirA family biotin operon repressor/biotin-[acetyl-CoA-carboxylase] ligase